MTMHFNIKALLAVTAMLMLPLGHAANISKDDYKAGKDRISAEYKADRKACDAMKANAKDICVAEAKAKEKIARAELEYSYTGKPGDQTKVGMTKANQVYEIAKERCDDRTGNDKDVCIKEARAVRTQALSEATMTQQTGEAKLEAVDSKRDADYKVAMEKCDAMSGDAKANCIVDAKARFGKN